VALALAVLGLLWWLRRRAQSLAGTESGRNGREGRRPWWRQRQAVLAAVLGLVVLAGATDYMGARFADIGPQYERFQAGDNNSEVGQRLALWGIALRAARHAPFPGVGFDGFGAETQRQRDTGELARDALVLYQGPHNEYLAGLSAAGIPGLIVIVLFFWAPLVVGCRRFLRGQQTETALTLVLFTASYAAFTMTDSLLDRQISLLAYVLLASWLMHGPGRILERNVALVVRQRVSTDLMERLYAAPLAWHETQHGVETAHRVQQTTRALYDFAQSQFIYLQSVVRLVGPVVALWLISPWVGVVAVVGYLVLAAIIVAFDKVMMRLAREENAADREYWASLSDGLVNVLSVLALRLQRGVLKLVETRLDAVFAPVRRAIVYNEGKWATVDLLNCVLWIVLLSLYVWLSMQGMVPAGPEVQAAADAAAGAAGRAASAAAGGAGRGRAVGAQRGAH